DDSGMRFYQIYKAEADSEQNYTASLVKEYYYTAPLTYPLYYVPKESIFSYSSGVCAKGTYALHIECYDENWEIQRKYGIGELYESEDKVNFDDPVLENLGVHFETVYSLGEYNDKWVEVCGDDAHEITEENITLFIE
ncbi:MAG: hypothetical protein ACI4XB_07485, partial [Ruminococcus sp.]